MLTFINKIDEDFDNKPVDQRIKDFSKLDELALKPQSKDEYLKNIPEKVIRDGKIIPLREEAAKRLNKEEASAFKDDKDDPLRQTIVRFYRKNKNHI